MLVVMTSTLLLLIWGTSQEVLKGLWVTPGDIFSQVDQFLDPRICIYLSNAVSINLREFTGGTQGACGFEPT